MDPNEAAQNRLKDYEYVFGTDPGQRVLRDIMAMGHMFESSVVHGDDKPVEFREGERNLVLRILASMPMQIDLLHALDQQTVDYQNQRTDPLATIGE